MWYVGWAGSFAVLDAMRLEVTADDGRRLRAAESARGARR
jgi:predicted outer membrane lipoprotein